MRTSQLQIPLIPPTQATALLFPRYKLNSLSWHTGSFTVCPPPSFLAFSPCYFLLVPSTGCAIRLYLAVSHLQVLHMPGPSAERGQKVWLHFICQPGFSHSSRLHSELTLSGKPSLHVLQSGLGAPSSIPSVSLCTSFSTIIDRALCCVTVYFVYFIKTRAL